jgi:hypothetical protein
MRSVVDLSPVSVERVTLVERVTFERVTLVGCVTFERVAEVQVFTLVFFVFVPVKGTPDSEGHFIKPSSANRFWLLRMFLSRLNSYSDFNMVGGISGSLVFHSFTQFHENVGVGCNGRQGEDITSLCLRTNKARRAVLQSMETLPRFQEDPHSDSMVS